MKFLNGFKTAIGIGVTLASIVLPALGKDAAFIPAVGETLGSIADNVYSVVTGAGVLLTLVGLKHKAEKAAGER